MGCSISAPVRIYGPVRTKSLRLLGRPPRRGLEPPLGREARIANSFRTTALPDRLLELLRDPFLSPCARGHWR
jgi:hypothetical protein